VGFKAERSNSHPLFHDIRPAKGGEPGTLDHHMDKSYMKEKAPDYLALACLQEGASNSLTTPLVKNTELHKHLLGRYPEDIRALSNPKSFILRKPASMGSDAAQPEPLLTESPKGPVFWLNVDHRLMEPQTAEAARALEHVREILHEVECKDVKLGSGDVLIVNNYKALHRDGHFTSPFTGADRRLMRSYFKSGKVPRTRIIK